MPLEKVVLSGGRFPLVKLPQSSSEGAARPFRALITRHQLPEIHAKSPLRTHLSLPPSSRRSTSSPQDRNRGAGLPAHERQRRREAPSREPRVGISSLELVGGRAVGGDEEGEALVEDLAHRLARRMEERGRRP